VNIRKFVFGLVPLDELVTVGTFTPQAAAFLEAAKANLEGTGEITLRRLVTEALRMRPSRLVIGEVRQAECLDLLIALNSGLPGACTLRAKRRCALYLCWQGRTSRPDWWRRMFSFSAQRLALLNRYWSSGSCWVELDHGAEDGACGHRRHTVHRAPGVFRRLGTPLSRD